jgi:hypothetical protein
MIIIAWLAVGGLKLRLNIKALILLSGRGKIRQDLFTKLQPSLIATVINYYRY